MKPAFIYHWWGPENVLGDIHNPIILSIATLRKFTDAPIHVISLSDANWKKFPTSLNFKVHRFPSYSEELGVKNDQKNSWRLCSQPFDVWKLSQNIEEQIIVFTDADVFWRQSPIPLDGDTSKFNMLFSISGIPQVNTGIYYFDKKSKDVKRFFEVWKSFTIRSFFDESLNKAIGDNYPNFWKNGPIHPLNDEHICCYIYANYPELFSSCCLPLSSTEHFIKEWSDNEWYDSIGSNPKNIHCPYIEWGPQMLNKVLQMKEFSWLEETLNPNYIKIL